MMRFNQGIPRHLSLGELRELRNILENKRKRQAVERRLHEYKPKKQFRAGKRSGKHKFKSNEKLQEASQKLLIQTMAELNVPVKGKKLFAAVLEAKLGKRFYREKRRDKLNVSYWLRCLSSDLAAHT